MNFPEDLTSVPVSPVGELTPGTLSTLDDESWLELSNATVDWTFPVETEEKDLVRARFDAFRSSSNSDTSGDYGNISSPLLLASAFLQYLLRSDKTLKTTGVIVQAIQRTFIIGTDVHSMASSLDTRAQSAFLKIYYSALSATRLPDIPSKSVLFQGDDNAQRHNIYAICGGQGPSNGSCLKELREIYNIYGSLLKKLIGLACEVLAGLGRSRNAAHFYENDELDLRKWLVEPDTAPSEATIASAPLSFPLIGLLSLSHYCITCKVLGKTPEQVRASFRGVTGHSQGVIVAAAIARSTSWDVFYDSVRFSLEALFWIGFEAHHEASFAQLPSAANQNCIDHGEGEPSPMLNVRGLDETSTRKLLQDTNGDLKATDHVYLALINSRDNTVIAGPPRSLYGVNLRLRDQKAKDLPHQSRIIFNQRKPTVKHQFLPISAAFHSPYADAAVRRILGALKSHNFVGDDLGISLYHTKNGDDIKKYGDRDVIESLIRMVTTDLVDWPRASSFPNATHVLDFGPGRIGALVHQATEGTGVRVISAAALNSPSADIGGKADMFCSSHPSATSDWKALYSPRLIRDSSGVVKLETRMTQLWGVPPVMVAGMTPTTVPWDFVATIMEAGYHAELAGGGYSNPKAFENAIQELSRKIPPKLGITCNVIYASPKSIAWQIPLIRRLIHEGYPIEGLTIGAGVPSAEVVEEYIKTMGLKHISFKPGSRDSIIEVIRIAKAHPDFLFGLQWTGGRGGGHHSFEDFHTPILETYGEVRKCANIVLVAGSGFGGSGDTYPYLTGEWSCSLGFPLMPFDGVLLGSRMMVAKEAHTAPQAKELIVQAQGVADCDWHKTYQQATGGVITVNSEMGQPIHKLATRGVLLWSELDRTIFSISDRSKRLAELQRKKVYIISRLNQDFQKPWFGIDSSGTPVDVEDMTYYDVVQRSVFLMYVDHQRRWIDTSYRTFVLDFTTRAQERLGANTQLDARIIEEPNEFLALLLRVSPSAKTEILHPEDVSYFFSLCLRRDQKPINFIPRLDENFETWFKKDSLWQAEDIEAVIGQDVQRICIIHGPVAAQHSRRCDESAKSILDEISNSHVEKMRQDFRERTCEISNKDVLPYLKHSDGFPHLVLEDYPTTKSYMFPITEPIPDPNAFSAHLLKDVTGWAHACLSDKSIIRDQRRHTNPIRAAFTPSPGHVLAIHYDVQKRVESLVMSKVAGPDTKIRPVLRASCAGGDCLVVTLIEPSPTGAGEVCLDFVFQYSSDIISNHLTEVTSDRNGRIKSFYSELWLGNYPPSLRDAPLHGDFEGPRMTLSREMVQNFMTATGDIGTSKSFQYAAENFVPLDICIVLAWDALVKPLLIRAIGGDLLRLLHRSNEFKYVNRAAPLRIGDTVISSSRIQSVTNERSGKMVEVLAVIIRNGKAVVEIKSTFVIQGTFTDFQNTFRHIQEPRTKYVVSSEKERALLMSREWVQITRSSHDLVGRKLLFSLSTQVTFDKPGRFSSLQVTGDISSRQGGKSKTVGTVSYETGPCYGNPVTDFLTRHGASVRKTRALQSPGWDGDTSWTIRAPKSNSAYARVSRDTNPIHVSTTFANYAQLPGVVTHGMFTSAAVRRAVESTAAEADFTRFRRYHASFESIVLPGDELAVDLQHEAMVEGRMVLKIQAFNKATGVKVLEAEAEVEQATTAYVFTGQGSQEKGMGMFLYKSSPVVKALWDRGDKHLLELYGFSIIDIVCNDPKTLTIHFNGTRGRKLRENYLAMTIERILPDRSVVHEPIIKNLTPECTSYTFSDTRGLLYSTQFAQPALTMMEMAGFEEAKSKGIVQEGAAFAGHSLGEYSALGAMGEIMSMESLVSLVFYRGLTMQVAIERDELGRTDFSMVAANPSRVGKTFDQIAFERVVDMITNEAEVLLEVVNYNVRGRQYVCAGHLRALWIMTQVLNSLARATTATLSNSQELLTIVRKHSAASQNLPKHITLERGTATIPLRGIDVPFHSSYIRNGVQPYRRYLETKILEENIEVERLVDRFIPNVTAKPFSVEREYVEEVAKITGSADLERLLVEMGSYD